MRKTILLSLICISTFAQKEIFKGQEPIKPVNTESRPINDQWKGVYVLGDISVSNDFDGGRLNKAEIGENGTLILTILPENEPINASPWYAFKIWSGQPKKVIVQLKYPENVKHRYNPKLSKIGTDWQEVTGEIEKNVFSFQVGITQTPTTIAAQPLVTSSHVNSWINSLSKIRLINAGKTSHGKDIPAFEFGNPKSQNKLVILGRQHPPEVTGHFALKSFVETLVSNDSTFKRLGEKFHILVFPLVNPDGVDNGHWRHNAGGVDLNRDWAAFNQPETIAIRDIINQKIGKEDRLHFAIDFHSTYEDIYYIVDPSKKSIAPGLIQEWLEGLKLKITNYNPNIKPLYFEPPTSTAFSYLYETYGAESLVYEIGDKTPIAFIEEKSKVSAKLLANLLLTRLKQ